MSDLYRDFSFYPNPLVHLVSYFCPFHHPHHLPLGHCSSPQSRTEIVQSTRRALWTSRKQNTRRGQNQVGWRKAVDVSSTRGSCRKGSAAGGIQGSATIVPSLFSVVVGVCAALQQYGWGTLCTSTFAARCRHRNRCVRPHSVRHLL